METITPETIKAAGDAIVAVIAAIGAVVATIASAVAGFYTWKNRYELDLLYAAKYRPNEDGSPGPMRKHPDLMVNMFERTPRPGQTVNNQKTDTVDNPDGGKAEG